MVVWPNWPGGARWAGRLLGAALLAFAVMLLHGLELLLGDRAVAIRIDPREALGDAILVGLQLRKAELPVAVGGAFTVFGGDLLGGEEPVVIGVCVLKPGGGCGLHFGQCDVAAAIGVQCLEACARALVAAFGEADVLGSFWSTLLSASFALLHSQTGPHRVSVENNHDVATLAVSACAK